MPASPIAGPSGSNTNNDESMEGIKAGELAGSDTELFGLSGDGIVAGALPTPSGEE